MNYHSSKDTISVHLGEHIIGNLSVSHSRRCPAVVITAEGRFLCASNRNTVSLEGNTLAISAICLNATDIGYPTYLGNEALRVSCSTNDTEQSGYRIKQCLKFQFKKICLVMQFLQLI
jgi:hypothetical protein